MNKTVFLTGATGFVGCHLADVLLRKGHTVLALVRPNQTHTIPQERLQQAIAAVNPHNPAPMDRLIAIEGDVVDSADQLIAQIKRQSAAHIDELWHGVATFQFKEVDRAKIEQINIGGTRTMLELINRVNEGQPPRYRHIGTAYSSGNDYPIVPEAITSSTQFRSLYEWSKHEGELYVQAAQREHNLDVMILRPSIIVGSANTHVFNHTAYYQVCGALFRMRERLAAQDGPAFDGAVHVRLQADPATELNFVPVDFVVDAMIALSDHGALEGPGLNVFNIANEAPPSMRLVHQMICETLNISDLHLVDGSVFDHQPMSLFEKVLARTIVFQAPYMTETISFEMNEFRRYLPYSKVATPNVDGKFLAVINQQFVDMLAQRLQPA